MEKYFTGSESEAMEEQHSTAQKEKAPAKKKGGVRRVKKVDLTGGGNGQKNGEGQRAYKRSRVDEGEKNVKVVGGGLEGQDLGGKEEVEGVEQSQRVSGGQGVDLVPLTLGQGLDLPPLVTPVHSENEGELDNIGRRGCRTGETQNHQRGVSWTHLRWMQCTVKKCFEEFGFCLFFFSFFGRLPMFMFLCGLCFLMM